MAVDGAWCKHIVDRASMGLWVIREEFVYHGLEQSRREDAAIW